ncbi:hypothetical protein UB34_19320, partial [Photobacterium leiognathi]|uniref:hypothetical protein n=1 Tax=Photobacterium leiognathi TaxID=553611 RepID=UPI0005D3C476
SGNMLSYRSAIEDESAIADVAALQALIDSVDASLAAFASVQAAASSSDASSITVDTLNAIRGLTFGSANVADYQAAIAAESAIADVIALQALIDDVDTTLSALSDVQAAAASNDASGLTLTTLSNINGLIYVEANLGDYQAAIAAESDIADVTALQALSTVWMQVSWRLPTYKPRRQGVMRVPLRAVS